MAIKYHWDIEQGTDAWHGIKLGILSGSNVNVILTPAGKPAKGQKVMEYAASIAAQRIFKRAEENFQSYLMMMGHLKEDVARDIYIEKYAPVRQCGFITNDNLGFTIGCSPDGCVLDDGGLEIKSRLAKFQIQTIISGEIDKGFMNQCQAFLLVSGRDWIDFVSYSPALPFFVKRVYPDPVRRDAIINAMMDFEEQVQAIMDEYQDKAADMVQTEWVDFGNDDEIEGSE